jgi:uncharacterized membrane protein
MSTKEQLDRIEKNVKLLEERILEKKPDRFSSRDIYTAFFGALIVGFAFTFNTLLIQVVKALDWNHVYIIIFATIAILLLQIYFIGYLRAKGDPGRNFFEFTAKRLPTFYLISLVVAALLLYVYGLNQFLSDGEWIKAIFAISLPCAAGAAISDLLKKY